LQVSKPTIRTKDERLAAGKALRDKCPRNSHGKVVVGSGGKRDVIALIEASNEDRLENLVPVRHGRMLQSPFAFFRGGAAIQAYDLADTPTSGIEVVACGDCHLLNFGGFATPERNIVFDINDFDETSIAPFEWDVKRLAASFAVAARSRDFRPDQVWAIAVESAAAYRTSMRERSHYSVLESWYSQITKDDVLALLSRDTEALDRSRKILAKAQRQTSEHLFEKLTTPVDGTPRIVDQPPLLYHSYDPEVTEAVVETFFAAYRETLPQERRQLLDRFSLADVALKVVGVGSVGTRCYIALFMADADDSLFLQVKEARRSVLEPYAGKGPAEHNGQRVVLGQRMMQSASDIFLGWTTGPAGREYYVRQLRDMKMSAMVEAQSPQTMRSYARLCGMALARAHDKAGDAATIAGYLGAKDDFDVALGDYALAYADQVDRDYATLRRAVASGRLKSDLSDNELATALR
jgi:uncharacterized protein (DUF2252 family)